MGKPVEGPRKIFKDFSNWTTSHSIPHIGQSRHGCLIVFWVIITIVAFGCLIWQTVMLAIRFSRRDVVVGLELRFEKRPFPAVTVCDLNPYRYSMLRSNSKVMDLLDTYKYALAKSACGSSRECIDPQKEEKLRHYGLQHFNDTVALQAQVRDYTVMFQAQTTTGEKEVMSTQRHSFLKSCSFNTKDCSIQHDFKEFLDEKLGKCFTFNYIADPEHQRMTNRAGPLYGLRLVLLTNVSDYVPFSEMAGMKIVIHNQSEHVFPDTYGYNVEIGTATSMGISFKEIIRLPAPYGPCIETEKANNYLYEGMYTSEGCSRSCYQAEIIEKCSCADPSYPIKDPTVPYCSPEDEVQRTCWTNLVSNGIDSCRCQLPCKEGVFEVTVSGSTWPSSATVTIADCQDSKAECQKQYRENGAMIEVYYEQLNYQLLQENAAYEFVNLASDFGGQIGLWMGLSVISMIEFFVLAFQLCYFCCSPTQSTIH